MYDLRSFSAHSIAPVHSQRMELELGLTISHDVDDFTPSADHLYHVVSRETDSMFILTAQIKGYEGEHVEILINEDGTRIAIWAQKPFLENWTVGWKMHKVKRKVFKIPDAVILDKIKAMFNEEESVLTISMPKAMKGIRGIGVEEVKEEQVVDKIDTSGPKQVPDIVQEVEGEKEIQERGNQEKEQEQKDDDVEAQNGLKKTREEVCLHEPPEREKEKTLGDEATQGNQPPEKRSMILAPVIAASAFLVSIIVLVIHLNRKKNPPRKSEN